jgi:signal transduction histidine kinase
VRLRILVTVMAVTAIAVGAFFVPAALAIRSRDVDAQRLDVQREAAVAVATIDLARPGDADLPVVAGHEYGLYDADGRLFHGGGPEDGGAPVRAALADGDALEQIDGQLIATLLVDDHDGRGEVVVLRVAEPADEAAAASRRAVEALALGAVAIVAAAGVVAYALTTRLTRPIRSLRVAASRLGSGDFTVRAEPTGVAELDEVAAAIEVAGDRLGTAMGRERAFSADASHQLRTPITAMRAAIEAEQLAPRPDPTTVLGELLQQTDRLEVIVVSLLALARETHDNRDPVDVRSILESARARWAVPVSDAGRALRIRQPDEPCRSPVSPVALGHVLDVLVDNAIRHGMGTITVSLDTVGSGHRIAVSDEGRLPTGTDLFARRGDTATGTGIGLQLARSLIEAEGGRLRATPDPTTFELTLPGTAEPGR